MEILTFIFYVFLLFFFVLCMTLGFKGVAEQHDEKIRKRLMEERKEQEEDNTKAQR